jgi:NO-binding membrane sensor protein with MHYT domain/nitrogen-specific signal transduction histidine kinase
VNPREAELCDPSLLVTSADGVVAQFSWDLRLVAVSLAVAIAGSFAALEVAQRFRAADQPRERRFLGFLGATLMGLAIWTMHFVGMLALRMPLNVAYHPGLTAASLLAAATGAGIAFSVIRRRRLTRFHLLTGGTAMGIAIAGMHYLGMASMEMPATVDYEPVRFAGSIALAIAASTGALFLAFYAPEDSRRALTMRGGSAVVMGFAIAGMHYLGMWAARYTASDVGPTISGRPMVGGIELGTVTVIAGGVFAFALIAQALRSSVEKDRALAEQRRLAGELERRVQERTLELEVANRDLSNFAYSVSHDLRSPLRVIVGFSGLLAAEKAAQLDPEARDRLERITAAGMRMDAMLSGLLALAHASTTPLNVTSVDLSALVRSIAPDIASSLPGKRVQLDIEPDVVAQGDVALLTSVLQNLLGNAWKFTHAENAKVTFGAERRSGQSVYFVQDNGPGFPPEASERIFSMFERLDQSTAGMGIGLAVARRAIERHGGTLWAESAPGTGAKFLFTLPGK